MVYHRQFGRWKHHWFRKARVRLNPANEHILNQLTHHMCSARVKVNFWVYRQTSSKSAIILCDGVLTDIHVVNISCGCLTCVAHCLPRQPFPGPSSNPTSVPTSQTNFQTNISPTTFLNINLSSTIVCSNLAISMVVLASFFVSLYILTKYSISNMYN